VNATERGDLAERLLPIAAGLACVVHGDGDRRDVARTLAELDQAERDALIVVLAGLVNPDTTVANALGYVTWDEHGRSATPTGRQETLRDIASDESTAHGRLSRVAAIVEDTAELAAQGVPRAVIAARLGIAWNSVQIAHSRAGVAVPGCAA
jgi:hypothetical protein